MGKIKQRNWLLLITLFLFVATLLLLLFTTKRNLGIGVCLYDDVEYQQNEVIPNYNGRNDCFCSWSGEIVCEDAEVSMSYESFSSENLSFTYSFRNFLEKASPDFNRIVLSDVNHQGTRLEILLEREVLCGENENAPTQIGMFERKNNGIILTTITNRDESLYSRTCLIGNTFVLEGMELTKLKEFSVLYQNESGQLFDLNICFFNGVVYGKGDVFKDSKRDMLCTCKGPEVDCEKLE